MYLKQKKEKSLIVQKNFKFQREHEMQEEIKWQCVNKSCKAKIYLAEDRTIILKDVKHNH